MSHTLALMVGYLLSSDGKLKRTHAAAILLFQVQQKCFNNSSRNRQDLEHETARPYTT
jgi:hypothetical protein